MLELVDFSGSHEACTFEHLVRWSLRSAERCSRCVLVWIGLTLVAMSECRLICFGGAVAFVVRGVGAYFGEVLSEEGTVADV